MNDSSSDSSSLQEEKPKGLQPKPHAVEGEDLINLPSRTLTNNARLDEYTTETTNGQILREVQSYHTGKIERYELVTWKVDDPENPKNWSKAFKVGDSPKVDWCLADNGIVVVHDDGRFDLLCCRFQFFRYNGRYWGC